MATIKSENWDSVTAPAIPTGWTVDTALVTATTNSPTSAPNSLVHPTASVNPANVPHATYATLDTASGNVLVSGTIRFGGTGIDEQDIWLFARSSVVAAISNWGTLSYYDVKISHAGASSGLFLEKRTANVSTTLGTVGDATTFADATNYRLYLSCNGTTIRTKVQRLSDSTWLNSSGTWVTDATGNTWAITVTDSSITGAGYSGIGFYLGGNGGSAVGIDDWLLEDFTTPPPPPSADTVPAVKVFYGGMPQ